MADIVKEKQEERGGALPRVYFRVCSKDEVCFEETAKIFSGEFPNLHAPGTPPRGS